MQPTCGMWIAQGTTEEKTKGWGGLKESTILRQFPTFYLHPEVQGITSRESAEDIARTILNPTKNQNIIVHVYAHLVSVESLCE